MRLPTKDIKGVMIKAIKRMTVFDCIMSIAALIIYVVFIFSKTDYYKKYFTPEHRNPNALVKIIRDIPSDPSNTKGSKEVQIGSRKYIIPNSIISPHGVRNERQNSIYIAVIWPTMEAVTEKNRSNENIIDIKMEARNETPHSASMEQLEREISGRHGKPILLSQHSDLQEYPNKNYFPFYRARDPSIVWADGLPAYFYCGGSAISLQNNGEPVVQRGRCAIQLTWPDSFNVDIVFDRSHLVEWRKVHDLSMALLNSMETDKNIARGTLLKDN